MLLIGNQVLQPGELFLFYSPLLLNNNFNDFIWNRLEHVGLDVSSEEYVDGAKLANEVEDCQCPPNYMGLSCEDCAPGYYRSPQKGPYGGFCVQCQCNGHSNECDVNTGKCLVSG